MNRILCPTDFSIGSLSSVTYAAKVAQKTGSELILVNIQSVWKQVASELVWGKSIAMQSVVDQLEELSEEISKVYHISCYGEVQSSTHSITQLIIEASGKYDLIIMATEEFDNVYEFFNDKGSYLKNKFSLVPILLLPPNCLFQNLSEIVYAADYFHDHRIPFNQLSQWAGLLGANVTILQVVTTPYRHEDDEKLHQIKLELAQFYGRDFSGNFKIVYNSHPAEGIQEYATTNGCDALAVSTRQYSLIERLFHKSVVRTLSTVSDYPLFVFHL